MQVVQNNKPRYIDLKVRLRSIGFTNPETNHILSSFREAGLRFGPKPSDVLIAEAQEARRSYQPFASNVIAKAL